MEIDSEHILEVANDKNHDERNCEICNPRFRVPLSTDVLERIRAFCLTDGMELKIENPLEIDILDCETLINEKIIDPVEEIDNWLQAYNEATDKAMED